MAIVKTGYSPTESGIFFAEESTWGTAVVTSMIQLKTLDGSTPGFTPTQFVDKTMLNQSTNIVDIDLDYYMTEAGQWQRIQIPEFICTSEIGAHFLYATIQQVTENASTPFIKTFDADSTSLDIDFSSSPSQGYFFTLLLKSPATTNSRRFVSCVMESLTFRLDRENGGRLICSGTAITNQGYASNIDPSSTVQSTRVIPNYFDTTLSTLVMNSIDIVWDSFEITVNNTWDYIGHTTSGTGDNIKLMKQAINANIVVKYDTNSDIFRDSVGTDIGSTTLNINNAATEGSFAFTGPQTWINSAVKESSGDTVQRLNLNIDFGSDLSAASYSRFTIVDGVDAQW